MLADIQDVLSGILTVDYLVSNNRGVTLGEEVIVPPTVITPPSTPVIPLITSPTVHENDIAAVEPNLDETEHLNPPSFPSVHRPYFEFDCQAILRTLATTLPETFVTSGVDLYFHYNSQLHNLMPIVKLSMSVLGAEAWRAYRLPESKRRLIAYTSTRSNGQTPRAKLTSASNILKRAIRYFSGFQLSALIIYSTEH